MSLTNDSKDEIIKTLRANYEDQQKIIARQQAKIIELEQRIEFLTKVNK